MIELDEYILEPAPNSDEDPFEGARYEYYKSNKILGQLYRAVDEHRIWKEHVRFTFHPQQENTSFWDDLLLKIQPRYEALTGQAEGWKDHMETARELRGYYEAAVSDAMVQYSEHPIKPLSELEVFIGNILSSSGVQTNRQRDASIKLGDEFERISVWIAKLMRTVSHNPEVPLTGYQNPFDNLHLCLACVYAGDKAAHVGPSQMGRGRGSSEMESFRVVAACALLAELRVLELRHSSGGGGYVGVRGNGSATV